jgi:hypothetical protein
VLAIGLLVASAGPAVADHEAPVLLEEFTVGDAPTPTTGYHAIGDGPADVDRERTFATFELPPPNTTRCSPP